MVIHVVGEGETIYSIAEEYGSTPNRIIEDNELTNPNSLVVGQTLVILFPSNIYTVVEGDTLLSVAQKNGVSVITLLQNNPGLADFPYLYVGQQIVISYEEQKLGSMEVNGYLYPYIDTEVLVKTLPFLTYVTVFTYGFTPEGELIGIDDEKVVQLARDYGVAPLMLISTLTSEGSFSNILANQILNNQEAQNRLIDNILVNLENKQYYGLDIDFEYIYPDDRQAYVDFVRNVTTRLSAEGYKVIVALAPKISSDQPGLLYEGHDYRGLGEAANNVLLMTYEWGYTYGPPMAVAPINKVREVLDYAVTEIDPSKIFMGIPNYGYDWALPFIRGESRAKSLSNVAAVEQAAQYGATIMFDEVAMAPYYNYQRSDGVEHVVWFEDARSIEAKLRLVNEYGFNGASYWNIMKYFPQNWLVLNALYNIEKVL
ncbi:glycosyl hydrolase family 18 protein [Anaerosporobacter faecicola]|uniref:glycosyl hydrolase family 18 protein n=1 Tax=Anaerosporobacter faecicola TaxID=2718714 RepID=UPI00143C6493|nr:glycosyl hydrolase family 18 protein [Anaerosporobacter faecicola]